MGVGIAHHFSGGVYIKEAHLTRGHGVEQHSHEHDHPAVLVYGTVRLFVEDEPSRILTGFNVIKIAAHKRHRVEVITDALWLCIWPTDDTDPETVDQTILKG